MEMESKSDEDEKDTVQLLSRKLDHLQLELERIASPAFRQQNAHAMAQSKVEDELLLIRKTLKRIDIENSLNVTVHAQIREIQQKLADTFQGNKENARTMHMIRQEQMQNRKLFEDIFVKFEKMNDSVNQLQTQFSMLQSNLIEAIGHQSDLKVEIESNESKMEDMRLKIEEFSTTIANTSLGKFNGKGKRIERKQRTSNTDSPNSPNSPSKSSDKGEYFTARRLTAIAQTDHNWKGGLVPRNDNDNDDYDEDEDEDGFDDDDSAAGRMFKKVKDDVGVLKVKVKMMEKLIEVTNTQLQNERELKSVKLLRSIFSQRLLPVKNTMFIRWKEMTAELRRVELENKKKIEKVLHTMFSKKEVYSAFNKWKTYVRKYNMFQAVRNKQRNNSLLMATAIRQWNQLSLAISLENMSLSQNEETGSYNSNGETMYRFNRVHFLYYVKAMFVKWKRRTVFHAIEEKLEQLRNADIFEKTKTETTSEAESNRYTYSAEDYDRLDNQKDDDIEVKDHATLRLYVENKVASFLHDDLDGQLEVLNFFINSHEDRFSDIVDRCNTAIEKSKASEVKTKQMQETMMQRMSQLMDHCDNSVRNLRLLVLTDLNNYKEKTDKSIVSLEENLSRANIRITRLSDIQDGLVQDTTAHGEKLTRLFILNGQLLEKLEVFEKNHKIHMIEFYDLSSNVGTIRSDIDSYHEKNDVNITDIRKVLKAIHEKHLHYDNSQIIMTKSNETMMKNIEMLKKMIDNNLTFTEKEVLEIYKQLKIYVNVRVELNEISMLCSAFEAKYMESLTSGNLELADDYLNAVTEAAISVAKSIAIRVDREGLSLIVSSGRSETSAFSIQERRSKAVMDYMNSVSLYIQQINENYENLGDGHNNSSNHHSKTFRTDIKSRKFARNLFEKRFERAVIIALNSFNSIVLSNSLISTVSYTSAHGLVNNGSAANNNNDFVKCVMCNSTLDVIYNRGPRGPAFRHRDSIIQSNMNNEGHSRPGSPSKGIPSSSNNNNMVNSIKYSTLEHSSESIEEIDRLCKNCNSFDATMEVAPEYHETPNNNISSTVNDTDDDSGHSSRIHKEVSGTALGDSAQKSSTERSGPMSPSNPLLSHVLHHYQSESNLLLSNVLKDEIRPNSSPGRTLSKALSSSAIPGSSRKQSPNKSQIYSITNQSEIAKVLVSNFMTDASIPMPRSNTIHSNINSQAISGTIVYDANETTDTTNFLNSDGSMYLTRRLVGSRQQPSK